MSRPLRVVSAALLALLVPGCQSVFFGFVNRSSADPDVSVVYDPERALALDVFRPRSDALAPAPMVVFLYGGAWQTGSREQYRFVGGRLADQGVLTIVTDYRTWPQTGVPGFVDAAARAVDWAHANSAGLGGDQDRTVEVTNSRLLHAALRATGVDSGLLVLPGAGHFAPAAAFHALPVRRRYCLLCCDSSNRLPPQLRISVASGPARSTIAKVNQ